VAGPRTIDGRGDIEVRSAGVAAFGGGGASSQTLAVLKKRGARLDGFRSQPVDEELIEWATHVFTMTRGHLEALVRVFPEAEEKMFLACEFVDLPGAGVGADVPDPIGQGKRAYEEVAATLELAIPGILGFLDQTE
jgi:protein-tyrosine-phosphatase